MRFLFSLLILLIAPTANAQDHSVWTRLLSQYVVESADGINRVDYAALKASKADRDRLDTYIESFESGDFQTESPSRSEFSAWANLYNALTVRLIVENYPVSSIREIGGGILSRGPWKKTIITIRDQDMSLDDIEHGVLRKKWDDPRVHYAVNCASIGCPNLQLKAWEAVTLDEALDDAARDYISHPRGVYVREDGRLKVSSIYKWFDEDFGGSQVGIILHISKYAPPALASRLSAETTIKKYRYDWSLNDVSNAEGQ